jgi:hypothetical protein
MWWIGVDKKEIKVLFGWEVRHKGLDKKDKIMCE